MEVTKTNFKAVLPNVVDAIDSCDFVAIDSEFTGLRTEHTNLNDLDTVEERYSKLRHSAQNFGMIQFGLSAFRYVPTKKKYSHATYCFYVLAKPGAGEICDTGSLNFLANNGFDFNKLYKEGIPYISMKEEAELRHKLKENPVEVSKPTPVKVTEIAAKTFLKETDKKVENFMNDATQQELVIDGKTLTGFHRKIIYNNIAAKYENIRVQSVLSDNGVRNLVIKKFQSQTALKDHIEEERQNILDAKIGFTHVIRKLLESNKPIVGHNLTLDLVHLFEKTVMPLPEKYETFKKMVLANFPTIYDTKLLARDPPFSEDIPITGLEILFGDLCEKYNPPEFEIDADHESFDISDSSKAHDAGYDAFMTGVCFATMVKRLDGATWAKNSVVKSKHLAGFSNRINNMCSHDIPFLNLGGSDKQPDRSRIFFVECLESWGPSDVFGLFHMLKNVKLVWINSTSLYVIPTDEIDLKTCKKHLKAIHVSCPPLVHVRMYNDTHGSKRKSESDNSEPLSNNPKEFKRLKSVGSSQLSQLTLESPSAEDSHKMITDDANADGKTSSDGVFQVPEDW